MGGWGGAGGRQCSSLWRFCNPPKPPTTSDQRRRHGRARDEAALAGDIVVGGALAEQLHGAMADVAAVPSTHLFEVHWPPPLTVETPVPRMRHQLLLRPTHKPQAHTNGHARARERTRAHAHTHTHTHTHTPTEPQARRTRSRNAAHKRTHTRALLLRAQPDTQRKLLLQATETYTGRCEVVVPAHQERARQTVQLGLDGVGLDRHQDARGAADDV